MSSPDGTLHSRTCPTSRTRERPAVRGLSTTRARSTACRSSRDTSTRRRSPTRGQLAAGSTPPEPRTATNALDQLAARAPRRTSPEHRVVRRAVDVGQRFQQWRRRLRGLPHDRDQRRRLEHGDGDQPRQPDRHGRHGGRACRSTPPTRLRPDAHLLGHRPARRPVDQRLHRPDLRHADHRGHLDTTVTATDTTGAHGSAAFSWTVEQHRRRLHAHASCSATPGSRPARPRRGPPPPASSTRTAPARPPTRAPGTPGWTGTAPPTPTRCPRR